MLRDPRFALHGPTTDPVEGNEADWPGEAKVSGRARLVGDRFVADIDEAVITSLDEQATMLVVEWWTPRSGLRRVERA